MKTLQKYNIDIYKLDLGTHQYQFEINDEFFEAHEQNLIEKGNAHVEVILEKSSTMLQLQFNINGQIELICDRSLRPFQYPLQVQAQLIVKFGETFEELSEEVVLVPEGTQKLFLASYIFEFIGLNVPMKKLHPDYQEEEDEAMEEEDGKLVYSSSTSEIEDEPTETEEKEIDPRWNALKNLKKDH